MKKCIGILVVLLGLVVSSFGDNVKMLGFVKDENGNFAWSDYDLTFGVCSYREAGSRLDCISGAKMGSYFQVPLAQYGATRANFGVVYPFVEFRRTRPEFSVSHLVGKDFKFPDWMPLEVGAYWAVSPWVGWGAQLGLVRIKF